MSAEEVLADADEEDQDYSWDSAAPADYDGDGTMDIAVYRPTDGSFHVRGIGAIGAFGMGFPLPGDYDGDGADEPSAAVWTCEGEAWWEFEDGTMIDPPGDFPVQGDYDGDGTDDPAGWDADTNTYHVPGVGVVDLPDPTGGGYVVPPALRHWLAIDIIRLSLLSNDACPDPDW